MIVNSKVAEVGHGGSAEDETSSDRLTSLVDDQALSVDLVSAFAGDRGLSEREQAAIETLKVNRGALFFSDLLYVITHRYFSPEMAEPLWAEILRHKFEMSATLKRNIRIAVASLDYLSNLTSDIQAATVIDEAQVASLVRRSLRDDLTGLFNHATCYQKINVELRRFERYRTVCSLMMIDVDDFKALNDQYGHQQGDRVLTYLGATLSAGTRVSDICCRYGGEEFAVILPSTNATEAGVLAERLRDKVSRTPSGYPAVTVSIGVAACDDSTKISSAFVRKADAALYQAKGAGKNRVVVSP